MAHQSTWRLVGHVAKDVYVTVTMVIDRMNYFKINNARFETAFPLSITLKRIS